MRTRMQPRQRRALVRRTSQEAAVTSATAVAFVVCRAPDGNTMQFTTPRRRDDEGSVRGRVEGAPCTAPPRSNDCTARSARNQTAAG
ncbi:hypothetical protein MTO96_008940 [Rhipicephalus appendiculatus]